MSRPVDPDIRQLLADIDARLSARSTRSQRRSEMLMVVAGIRARAQASPDRMRAVALSASATAIERRVKGTDDG